MIDFSTIRAAVLGDVILDEYTTGTVARISPEAPVPVLREHHTTHRLGGAAAVANIAATLGAHVTLIGVTGDDPAARKLTHMADAAGIESLLFTDAHRCTTVKRRFLSESHNRQQLLRLDNEHTHPIRDATATQIGIIGTRLDDFDVILIADYAKGVCTEALRPLIEKIIAARLPVIVDPSRSPHWDKYYGVTGMTPNTAELGHFPDPMASLNLDWLCHTQAADGIQLTYRPHGSFEETTVHLATRPRHVADVTGAGDTVLAVLGLATAAGIDIVTACRLANQAAGVQVESSGVAAISPESLEC